MEALEEAVSSQEQLLEVIDVEGLAKRYPGSERFAVDHISFRVKTGEVFGLLGPNGAGKTTTLRMLTTRLPITEGRAMVAGVDVQRDPVTVRRRIGVVPQHNNLDRSLSVREILIYHAAYHGLPAAGLRRQADALLERLGLAERAGDKVDRLSGGMVKRLMLARALMHQPQVLFLDEPTAALDPQSRLFLWEMVQEVRSQGRTVIVTTHDMHEAERLCQRVAIMGRGRVLALGTPAKLKRQVPGSRAVKLEVALPAGVNPQNAVTELAARLQAVAEVCKVEPEHGGGPTITLRVYLSGEVTVMAPLVEAVTRSPVQLRSLQTAEPTLEDVFIHLTGRSLRS